MLRVESYGSVVRITLDRPAVRNAFNDELIGRLSSAFEELGEETRVVVLSGEGQAFCAGGDLEWMRRAAGYTEEENRRDALALAHLFERIARCPAVVIAKVHGAVFGGGCGLVAAADVALAVEGTKFAFSEVRLGLIPATICPFVVAKIGRGHARALFATGIAFDAEHAQGIGLIHGIFGADDIDNEFQRYSEAVHAAGPGAVAAAKNLVLDGDLSLEEYANRLARARSSEEGKEGITAFLEKRRASFVVSR
jgi:methylglutaconyl-CoA hydratase